MFCGTTPEEVAAAVRNEIEACEGLSVEEIDTMEIVAFDVTQQEIDAMGEFAGW